MHCVSVVLADQLTRQREIRLYHVITHPKGSRELTFQVQQGRLSWGRFGGLQCFSSIFAISGVRTRVVTIHPTMYIDPRAPYESNAVPMTL